MGMFDFASMMDNYEQRAVDRYVDVAAGLIIDIAAVNDSDKPFETAVLHPLYHDKWIIVELYDTAEEAQRGHGEWIKKMTGPKLPEKLVDVSTAGIAGLCDIVGDTSWRAYPKMK